MTGCNCNSSSCSCSCDITSLPTGADGLNGYNAYTQSTSTFIVPAIGSDNTIYVSNLSQFTGEWAATGQVIFIENAGYYEVVTEGTTSLDVRNLGYPGNALVGLNILPGARVCPGGLQGLQGLQGIQGIQGIQGPVGPTGPAGADGLVYQTLILPGTTTRWFENSTGSSLVATYFIYPGSLNTLTPVNIKITALNTSNTASGIINISDETNALDWVSGFSFVAGNTSVNIIDLGVPTNISTGEAVIMVTISGTLGATLKVFSMTITYA